MNDWKKLASRVERELAVLRTQLEKDQPPEQTAALRARIRQCKWFLGLPRMVKEEAKDKPTKEEDTDE